MTFLLEVGFGGVGGDGGKGGNGGNGGTGQPGLSAGFHLESGTPPTLLETNFNLAAQPVIRAENVACAGTPVAFTGPVNANWNFGASAVPSAQTGTVVTTQFSNTGKQSVTVNGQLYKDFLDIRQAGADIPIATTTAPLINGTYRVCQGATLDFAALNAGTGYIYHWDFDGATTPNAVIGTAYASLNNLLFQTIDTFHIQLRYENDCCGMSIPDTIFLIVDPIPALVLSPDASFCQGTGGIPLWASGGAQYQWSPVQGLSGTSGPTVQANPSSSITYHVTALNAGSTCYDTASVHVNVESLDLSPTITDANCLPNGSVTLAVAGGSGTYQYEWAGYPAVNGPTLSSLGPGLLSVLVTDQVSGCEDSTELYVGQTPGSLDAYVASTQEASCFGGTDGAATVVVTGHSQPLSYAWSPNVGTGASVTGIPGGTYTMTATEAGTGCETSISVIVPEPPAINLAVLTQSDPDCNAFGTATVNASGGTGPYAYLWNTSPAQSLATATGLEAQTYQVTVLDQHGCPDTLSVVIPGPQSPINAFLVSTTDASSCTASDGSVTVGSSGGGGSVTYSWQTFPPQTGPTATNLSPGSYLVEVSGVNGCDVMLPLTLGPVCALSSWDWELGVRPTSDGLLIQWELDQGPELTTLTLEKSTEAGAFFFLQSVTHDQWEGEYLDQEVGVQSRYQYRLRGEDADHLVYYSAIVEGVLFAEQTWRLAKVFPLPVDESVNAQIWSPTAKKVACSLYHIDGRLVRQVFLELIPGYNTLNFSMNSESAGYYVLEFSTLGEPRLRASVMKW